MYIHTYIDLLSTCLFPPQMTGPICLGQAEAGKLIAHASAEAQAFEPLSTAFHGTLSGMKVELDLEQYSCEMSASQVVA